MSFEIGQHVIASWKGRGRYPAVIQSIDDGTYSLVYADGDADPRAQKDWVLEPINLPIPHFECKCEAPCLGYLKICPTCDMKNPRFARPAITIPRFMMPRPPRVKVPLETIPTWPAYWDTVLAPHKDQILANIPPSLAGKFTIDPTINSRIRYHHGDITALEVDAVVNAANSGLFAGGGVCGAIHDAAGDELAGECREIGGCPTGSSVITKGYNLFAKHVIHSVGPMDGDHQLLASAYRTALDVAAANSLNSIAFCCISTGVFGFPNRLAALIALTTVRQWLTANPDSTVNSVIFCTFMEEDKIIYNHFMPVIFPTIAEHVQSGKDDDEDEDADETGDENEAEAQDEVDEGDQSAVSQEKVNE